MMNNKLNLPQYHYHLIAGNVIYQENNIVGEPENPMRVMTLNSIIRTDTDAFAVRYIAQAQQSLQYYFHEKMHNNNLRVVDVVILNVSYLGNMSEEEFHHAPEGTEKKEQQ